ncbi:response regulator [Actinomadura alba]|uniref:Response regulator transcription factor n=1 Tax=Actinomadura alba TaxID=406431 RepID=A0ABR7LR61_9ACTN|nr:response regulator transcription factor [Actinomadura alba]MBC6467333.1 response regulator transcription factor [Actinomadura alba]
MIRVAIMDDHPVARRGMAQILLETGRIELSVSAASPSELAEWLSAAAPGGSPDVVVLDLYSDGLYSDGHEPCMASISDFSEMSRVLVMSASGRPEDVVGAVRAGATGYVTKHASPEMFVSAVETVAAGGFALSSQLADILHSELARSAAHASRRRSGRATGGELSAREEETLGLIAQGFTHAQAASRMGVSKATVDTYVERVRAKLRLGNKAELTRAALARPNRPPLP